ncbi:MAG: SurA N-terminal domain-containing protein [Thermodesulfovibrionales bacterium]|nr:SurA N-terminal domain-containing protein [Thermodesulfovibrionales bacterium]
MLKSMRRHAKYFYVLFVLVILSFLFWGVGTVDQSASVPVATVGKEKISVEEYWRAYETTVRLSKEVYKEKFDAEMEKKLKLKEKVLNNLINERVIQAAAEDSGMRVTDEELEDSITHDPTFLRDGAFNRDTYLRTLKLNRMTPQAYEAMKRRGLIAEKMINLVTEPVDIPPEEFEGLSGDEAIRKELKELLLADKKEKALQSYIEGLKLRMDIKVNNELISD